MNPPTTASSYRFIVGPTPQKYTITLNVTYQVGPQKATATGQATVTFTSDAPTGSLTVPTVGTQTYAVNGDTITVELEPQITIDASVSTGSGTGGQFMFMQICTGTLRWFTNANGNFWRANVYKLQNNGGNFEGNLIDGTTLGYPFSYGGNPNNYSITVNANGYLPVSPWNFPNMSDGPQFEKACTFIKATDYFSTYLMYQSSRPGSVWIALSEVDWEWSETQTAPFANPDPNPTKQPAPTIKMPSGSAAFPGWVNTTPNLTASPWMSGKPPGA